MEMEQPARRAWKLNIQLMIAVACVLLGIILLLWTFVIGPRVVQPALSPADVIAQFQAAGLEAENPTPLTPQDYGEAPQACPGERFLIPSLKTDQVGRAFVCTNTADRDALKEYYEKINKETPAQSSWVMVYSRTVVQISGELDEPLARRYEEIIRQLP